MSSEERPGDAAPGSSFGVIITNRDRTGPLGACLASLAAQDIPPAWALLSDLGSTAGHRAALAGLADRHQVSYLRIEHAGEWNKPLAFNTAFKVAARSLPPVTHMVQLDADMILHPGLFAAAAARLRTVQAFCCAPRIAPPRLRLWSVAGDRAEFERMLAQCPPDVESRAVGVFMVLPSTWLSISGGFDERYTGWGHEDTELWWRARQVLTCAKDISGSLLIHQWHPRQPGAGRRGPNWPRFVYGKAGAAEPANPRGWGNGQVTQAVLRPGRPRPADVINRRAAC